MCAHRPIPFPSPRSTARRCICKQCTMHARTARSLNIVVDCHLITAPMRKVLPTIQKKLKENILKSIARIRWHLLHVFSFFRSPLFIDDYLRSMITKPFWIFLFCAPQIVRIKRQCNLITFLSRKNSASACLQQYDAYPNEMWYFRRFKIFSFFFFIREQCRTKICGYNISLLKNFELTSRATWL